jgi:hypothetical protein
MYFIEEGIRVFWHKEMLMYLANEGFECCFFEVVHFCTLNHHVCETYPFYQTKRTNDVKAHVTFLATPISDLTFPEDKKILLSVQTKAMVNWLNGTPRLTILIPCKLFNVFEKNCNR